MKSPSDTSFMEEEGADVDRVDRDGAEWVGVAESVCRDLNCASLRFMVVMSMAQI